MVDEANVGDWIVVWTKSRAEKKVEARIAAAGFQVWLPATTVRRRWSDRWQDVVLPLFPGYLFVRAAEHWAPLLRVSGVLTVVRTGTAPALLDDDFISGLRNAVSMPDVRAEPVMHSPEFRAGDQVVVQDGPLAGFRGIVREIRSERWLVVWIRQIGRGAQFTIGSSAVAPAS